MSGVHVDQHIGTPGIRRNLNVRITEEQRWGRIRYYGKSAAQKNEVFPLRISRVNVTKSAGNCGFCHIS